MTGGGGVSAVAGIEGNSVHGRKGVRERQCRRRHVVNWIVCGVDTPCEGSRAGGGGGVIMGGWGLVHIARLFVCLIAIGVQWGGGSYI